MQILCKQGQGPGTCLSKSSQAGPGAVGPRLSLDQQSPRVSGQGSKTFSGSYNQGRTWTLWTGFVHISPSLDQHAFPASQRQETQPCILGSESVILPTISTQVTYESLTDVDGGDDKVRDTYLTLLELGAGSSSICTQPRSWGIDQVFLLNVQSRLCVFMACQQR